MGEHICFFRAVSYADIMLDIFKVLINKKLLQWKGSFILTSTGYINYYISVIYSSFIYIAFFLQNATQIGFVD